MIKKYVKFSDERNQRYSVKTIIGENNGDNYVIKEAIYPEGQQHMEKILSNYNLLLDSYDVRPCKSWHCDDGVAFEYIKGESLTKRYLQAVYSNDIALYKKILDAHKKIIIGKEENRTIYQCNESFREIFGSDDMFDGCPALKCSNFDAISSNIIYQDDEPVFIDYEWVYDFVVPVDLVIYHCVADMYLHDASFEKFMPLDNVIEYLEINVSRDILQSAMESFHKYIISENDGESYALVKAICLKNEKKLVDVMQEKLICECEIERLQGVITDANNNLLKKEEEIGCLNTKLYDVEVQKMEELASLNTKLYDTEMQKMEELASLNTKLYNTEMQKMEELALLNTKLYEVEVEKMNFQFELQNIKKELEKVIAELDKIHTSIAWKVIDKFRRKKR